MPPFPQRRDLLTVAALSLVVLASRLILLYRNGSPEPDSLAMVAGLTMALRGDVPIREAFLYGREGSAGMVLVGRFVYPLFSRDPANLLPFLNWITVLASVAMVWPAFGIARRFFTSRVAAAAVLIALLTPAVWELSTYFHPEIPAAALLLLAVYAAIGADRSRAGRLRPVAAVLLGAGAFLCRVHVAFALPGLLTAAFLSARRARNLAIIVSAVVLGAGAYAALQSAIAPPDRAPSAGFLGYLSMIAGMYTHSFSLNGLARSTVWAVLGLGIVSVAALGASWRPWRDLTPESRTLRRGVLIGLVWALPFLLFWLPQPVPILRHYVLPAFGIVLAMACGIVAARSDRRFIAIAAMILAGNLAIPEIAYRAYNTRHPDASKTPHGAVLYTHDVMVGRIARFDRLSASMIRATQARENGGALVFTQWEGYAHVLYQLARSEPGLRPISTTMFFESVQDRRYDAGGHEVQFINYVYFEDPELLQLGVDLIRERVAGGVTVFVPRELANGLFGGMLSGAPVNVY